MAWFHKSKEIAAKPESPKKEDIWIQCPSCKAHIYKDEWGKNLKVCDRCHFHERLTWKERVDVLLDEGTFVELNAKVSWNDPLKFSDSKGPYAEKAVENCEKTGMKESVATGAGKINGIKVAIAIMDFRFMGGSLASGTGEKILQTALYAIRHKLPYIILSASGGARMHEGIISLMQMPKTCAALAQLREANLPYISIMTDPTTGGVSASFAMVGDIHIAEPRSLIGFAGRRVIEETIKQKLPEDFQTAEYLVDHGFVDMIVHRKDMKDMLSKILKYAGCR
ncbi:MAG: acetyl-CoA carboxylase, carboxyltransferase subunit beta [bacterium]